VGEKREVAIALADDIQELDEIARLLPDTSPEYADLISKINEIKNDLSTQLNIISQELLDAGVD